MSGSESDESLKISFADAWNEISEVIADGEVEIKSGQKVPVKVFLGGDHKVCIIKIPICILICVYNDSVCLDGYFISSINSFFLLSVGEVSKFQLCLHLVQDT